jgi:hypothetical protein
VSKELKCEFEVPPHTKVRVVAVVDSRLKDEMELIHEAECKLAEECDREVPDWSNTLEMLFRKGVRAYRQNAKRG